MFFYFFIFLFQNNNNNLGVALKFGLVFRNYTIFINSRCLPFLGVCACSCFSVLVGTST